MSARLISVISAALLVIMADAGMAAADEIPSISSMRIEEPAKHLDASYDQLLDIQVAPYTPTSVRISNGSYAFDYSDGHSTSYLGEVGWALKLFDLGKSVGSIYFEENLLFSTFGGSVAQEASLTQVSGLNSSYSLYLIGADTRLMYALNAFPVKALVPFVDAGYQGAFYYQPGGSGLDSLQGTLGNAVAGAGLRLWLNRTASISGESVPIFLSAKCNRIFPNGSGLDLASSTVFGGLAIGL